MRSTAETFAARSRFAKFSLKGNAMQQVMLALSIATFEGYLAEIYEVGRQILQSTHKRGWFHIGTDISSGTSFMQLKPIRDHPKRTSSLKVLWGPQAL